MLHKACSVGTGILILICWPTKPVRWLRSRADCWITRGCTMLRNSALSTTGPFVPYGFTCQLCNWRYLKWIPTVEEEIAWNHGWSEKHSFSWICLLSPRKPLGCSTSERSYVETGAIWIVQVSGEWGICVCRGKSGCRAAALPESYSDADNARATQWAAKAFLGQAIHYAGDWAAAEPIFRDIVENGGFIMEDGVQVLRTSFWP